MAMIDEKAPSVIGYDVTVVTKTGEDVVSAVPPDAPADTTLPKVDTDKIARREAKAVERMERQMKSRGVGVTEQAQRLFDNLSKTMPCKWQNTTIEVFDAVVITSPYTLETCAFRDAADESTTVMERVQAVLGEELKKLESEDSQSQLMPVLSSGPEAVGAPGTPQAGAAPTPA